MKAKPRPAVIVFTALIIGALVLGYMTRTIRLKSRLAAIKRYDAVHGSPEGRDLGDYMS